MFLPRPDGRFEPHRVETGPRLANRVEVLRGLAEGDTVVAIAGMWSGERALPARGVVTRQGVVIERSAFLESRLALAAGPPPRRPPEADQGEIVALRYAYPLGIFERL